jgi:hypothetical protein
MSGIGNWIVYNKPRMNPFSSGPFAKDADIEAALRKLYAEIPGVNCTVLTVGAGGIDVKGGLWWLETEAEASSIVIAPTGAPLTAAGRRFKQLEWKRSLWDRDRPDRPQFKASFGSLKFHVIRNDNGTWGYDGNNRYESEDAAKEAAQADFERQMAPALEQTAVSAGDDLVDGFASAVKDEIARLRESGAGDFADPERYPVARLSRALVESVERYGPLEVGVFAALLYRRGQGIAGERERYADKKTQERAAADVEAHRQGRDPDAERAAASEKAKRDLEEAYGGQGKRKGKRK